MAMRNHTHFDRSVQTARGQGIRVAPAFVFGSAADGAGVFGCREPEVVLSRGDLLWTISTHGETSALHEQINTEQALETVAEPLGGARRSVRRWLFFRIGHRQVMLRATRNIAALLDDRGPTGSD